MSQQFKKTGPYLNDCPMCGRHNALLQSIKSPSLYDCRDCKRVFESGKKAWHLVEPIDPGKVHKAWMDALELLNRGCMPAGEPPDYAECERWIADTIDLVESDCADAGLDVEPAPRSVPADLTALDAWTKSVVAELESIAERNGFNVMFGGDA